MPVDSLDALEVSPQKTREAGSEEDEVRGEIQALIASLGYQGLQDIQERLKAKGNLGEFNLELITPNPQRVSVDARQVLRNSGLEQLGLHAYAPKDLYQQLTPLFSRLSISLITGARPIPALSRFHILQRQENRGETKSNKLYVPSNTVVELRKVQQASDPDKATQYDGITIHVDIDPTGERVMRVIPETITLLHERDQLKPAIRVPKDGAEKEILHEKQWQNPDIMGDAIGKAARFILK